MSLSRKDHDLLARLNALKPSVISIDNSLQVNPVVEDDLAKRFLRFRMNDEAMESTLGVEGSHAEGAVARKDEEDQTIEELLADIGPEDQWTLSPDDSKDIQRLVNEAKVSLKDEMTEAAAEEPTEDEDNAIAGSKAAQDLFNATEEEMEATGREAKALKVETSGNLSEADRKNQNDVEDTEADAALQRILDEISLENDFVDRDLKSTEQEDIITPVKRNSTKRMEEDQRYDLNLPSAPDMTPIAREIIDTAAEPSGLELPSVPTTLAGKESAKSNLPTYTNEEIETWCVICNDDATVRCNGCEGDLYCGKCWKEGHTGPDVGFEEKMHRWVKYTKSS